MSAERLAKRIVLLLALVSASVAVRAASGSTLTEILAERSGLTSQEVASLLASCDANPTSMRFCAWRDQLIAERRLEQLIDEKRTASPQCAAALARKLAAWQKRRDQTCKQSAHQQWGSGSMLSAAEAMCQTDRTKQMTQSISASTCP
ncbi:MAG: DUF1311 domain-containing protein [Paraburkholderia sp.]|nr:MAG: DUF1311 domain-containing protein [Paraburkholderia sp.]